MPDIPVGSQIFDLAFHPTNATVYTGLLDGHIKSFRYDEQGQHEQAFSVKPSKRSCRSLVTNEDGSRLYAAGKAKSILYALCYFISAVMLIYAAPSTQILVVFLKHARMLMSETVVVSA